MCGAKSPSGPLTSAKPPGQHSCARPGAERPGRQEPLLSLAQLPTSPALPRWAGWREPQPLPIDPSGPWLWAVTNSYQGVSQPSAPGASTSALAPAGASLGRLHSHPCPPPPAFPVLLLPPLSLGPCLSPSSSSLHVPLPLTHGTQDQTDYSSSSTNVPLNYDLEKSLAEPTSPPRPENCKGASHLLSPLGFSQVLPPRCELTHRCFTEGHFCCEMDRTSEALPTTEHPGQGARVQPPASRVAAWTPSHRPGPHCPQCGG